MRNYWIAVLGLLLACAVPAMSVGQEEKSEQDSLGRLEVAISELAEAREEMIEELGREHPKVKEMTAKLRKMMSAFELFANYENERQQQDGQRDARRTELAAIKDALREVALSQAEMAERFGEQHPKMKQLNETTRILREQLRVLQSQVGNSDEAAEAQLKVLVGDLYSRAVAQSMQAGEVSLELDEELEELADENEQLSLALELVNKKFGEKAAKLALAERYLAEIKPYYFSESEYEFRYEDQDEQEGDDEGAEEKAENWKSVLAEKRQELAELRNLKLRELREQKKLEVSDMGVDLEQLRQRYREVLKQRMDQQQAIALELLRSQQGEAGQAGEEGGDAGWETRFGKMEERVQRVEDKLDLILKKLGQSGDGR